MCVFLLFYPYCYHGWCIPTTLGTYSTVHIFTTHLTDLVSPVN